MKFLLFILLVTCKLSRAASAEEMVSDVVSVEDGSSMVISQPKGQPFKVGDQVCVSRTVDGNSCGKITAITDDNATIQFTTEVVGITIVENKSVGAVSGYSTPGEKIKVSTQRQSKIPAPAPERPRIKKMGVKKTAEAPSPSPTLVPMPATTPSVISTSSPRLSPTASPTPTPSPNAAIASVTPGESANPSPVYRGPQPQPRLEKQEGTRTIQFSFHVGLGQDLYEETNHPDYFASQLHVDVAARRSLIGNLTFQFSAAFSALAISKSTEETARFIVAHPEVAYSLSERSSDQRLELGLGLRYRTMFVDADTFGLRNVTGLSVSVSGETKVSSKVTLRAMLFGAPTLETSPFSFANRELGATLEWHYKSTEESSALSVIAGFFHLAHQRGGVRSSTRQIQLGVGLAW